MSTFVAVKMSDTLHGGKAQTDFRRFPQNSASAVVGIYRGGFSGIGRSLCLGRDTRIPKIRAESRAGHRPVPGGAFLLGRYALVRSRKLLEIEEVPIVSTPLYKARPDPELVAMCLTGDATAWETLVRRYRRFIYSIPVKFGLQPQDAADIFQTVCVKWIEHLHELDRKSTRLNSSHLGISYAVFCLKKKNSGKGSVQTFTKLARGIRVPLDEAMYSNESAHGSR